MKSFTFLTLAAGVAATGFHNANPFTCPTNTDNKCEEKQKSGFDWSDLSFGSFSKYNNFDFKGWTCGGSEKRDRLGRRTSGKHIGATCSQEKSKCPSFGSPDKFSLDEIHVSVEFDCDLEFHYDMPDGSLCRQRSACKAGGSKVKNSQCGGAKSVTIVYPTQNKPKKTCSVTVTSINFDCSTRTSSTIRTTATTSKPVSLTSETVKTTTAPTTKASSTLSIPSTTSAPTTSAPSTGVVTSSSTKPVETTSEATSSSVITTSFISTSTVFTTSVQTITSCSEDVKTCPGRETTAVVTVTIPVSTTLCPVTETQTVPVTTKSTKPVETQPTSSTKPAETTSQVPVTSSSVITTSFLSTSTVFTTSVQTVTSCADSVKTCPGRETTAVVTVTVPVSTTICPVTETQTVPITKPTKPAESETKPVPQTTTTSNKPIETLPCPDVVPKCLNTWIFSLGCRDNTDSSCYCPDTAFVENIFTCIYAHGETDSVVSEAIVYFQGICAKHIPQNPAIVTGPTVTSYITVTSTPATQPNAAVTTIVVERTTVVPCTDSAGSTISSSSTTKVISTAVTVPRVEFTTGASSEVVLVPATGVQSVVQPTGLTTTGVFVPTGTGSVRPSSTSPVLAAAGRVQAGGLAGLAVMAIVAAL